MIHITPNSLLRIAHDSDDVVAQFSSEPACGAAWSVLGPRRSNTLIVLIDTAPGKSHQIERIADVTCGACRALLDVALARGNVAQAIAMLTQKTVAR